MENIVPLLPEFKTCPAVFAVGKDYQIMVPVKNDVLFWVTVNGIDYYDHSNGIIRSSTRIHRVTVPSAELDRAGEYTVSYRKIIDRKPYFPETEPPVSARYAFKPVPKSGKVNIYHLSDTHGIFDFPAMAGGYFDDKPDIFILNGDIPDHSGSIDNFDLIYKLCESVTGGSRPCIFSRGNHDTRGFYAENIAEYTPTKDGKSYFTFRAGCVWGIVMDCGEDKEDSFDEYGHTVCCHSFRCDETKYLENIIKDAQSEYLDSGVKYKLVIVHNPFSMTLPAPFDIEQDLFKNWLDLLGNSIKPHIMLCGHLHTTEISPIGGKLDDKGQVCPVVIGSRDITDSSRKLVDFVGCAIVLDNSNAQILFTNKSHSVVEVNELKLF